jgi:DNA-binding CsgD family transcriptional regulator
VEQHKLLSKREEEVVQLLLKGNTNKLIASSLGISDSTVEFHLKNIYAKHQVSSRVELILKLGNTTGPGETAKQGISAVEIQREDAEDGGTPNPTNWATSLRETISLIGKELNMQRVANSDSRDGATPMSFFESIRVCLTKYAEFRGRASRSEFWWFALFVALVTAALTYVSEALAGAGLIVLLLPFLAAGTRRLRDSGKSGWWQFFLLVPVGGIVTLGFLWAMPPTSPQSEDALPA